MGFPSFVKLGHELFRRYITDGVSASGAWRPVNEDIQAYLLTIEAALNAHTSRAPLINGQLVASVSANVLTIAIKTLAGADPSLGDAVYADFRSATQTDGSSSILAITAALSLTVPAAATIGFANGIPGRLWATLFNNGGAPLIGIFNAYGGNTAGAPGRLFPLYPSLVTSSTGTPANSAGVHYTGTAVASKAFLVLGHLTWETPLATAGTWSAAPDVVHQQRFGDLIPGDQVQRASSYDATENHQTTTTTFGNSIPTNAAGNQFMSLAITPASKANILEIDHQANYAYSVAAHITVALHQDAIVNALSAKGSKVNTANDVVQIGLRHAMLAATNASTTFKIRAGGSTAGTIDFNGSNSVGIYGGVDFATLEITERMG